MQIPVQITVRDIPQSEAVETRIRQKVQKLEEFYAHIISCRVVLEAPHRHKQQGKEYTLRIDIGVPGHEIVVNRDHHEDVYVALRDGFDSAKRQLGEYVHRTRRETKKHAAEQVGACCGSPRKRASASSPARMAPSIILTARAS